MSLAESILPLEALDALIAEIEAALTSTRRIARLAGLPRLRAARAHLPEDAIAR